MSERDRKKGRRIKGRGLSGDPEIMAERRERETTAKAARLAREKESVAAAAAAGEGGAKD